MKRVNKLVYLVSSWLIIACGLGGLGCPLECKEGIEYPHPGSCGTGAPENQPGGKCSAGWSCTQDTECIAGVCLPCGGPGEACCGPTKQCGPGVCGTSPEFDYPTCDWSQSPVDPVACTGQYSYVVTFIDINTRCAEPTYPVQSDDDAEATSCGWSRLKADVGDKSILYEIGPLNQVPISWTLCQHVDQGTAEIVSAVYPVAYSHDDAVTCAVAWYGPATYTDADQYGNCQ